MSIDDYGYGLCRSGPSGKDIGVLSKKILDQNRTCTSMSMIGTLIRTLDECKTGPGFQMEVCVPEYDNGLGSRGPSARTLGYCERNSGFEPDMSRLDPRLRYSRHTYSRKGLGCELKMCKYDTWLL
ncbi:hypothetical protein QAD02_022846 [Eretmocerus hayati]|uniref:Uncharacterized protein n=1 Tax=Eretmocerus hayati TaxID=131215 RepID=A0ACC2PUD2_9HYME|nr:hypothetical protein QAD02_022846 [Eretmocerus hayati]